MSEHFSVAAGHSGGARSLGLHILRETELERDEHELAEHERDEQIITRNLPGYALREDPEYDALVAHALDWRADKVSAEERIERELERGILKPKGGERPVLRNEEERALALLTPRFAEYAAKSRTEKQVVRLRAFVIASEEREAARPRPGGGEPRTHLSMVASYDEPTNRGEIRTDVERFVATPLRIRSREARDAGRDERGEIVRNPLREMALIAVVHPGRNGDVGAGMSARERHVHLLGIGKIEIHPSLWTSLDEHWVRGIAERTRDHRRLMEHIEKKAETYAWKREARERHLAGLPPLDKPHRAADERDQQACRVRSQCHADLKTIGLDPRRFRVSEHLIGARSNDETRRLIAVSEVATERYKHALATGRNASIDRLAERAAELHDTLAEVRAHRLAKGREDPPLYRTDRQTAEITRLRQERVHAAPDDRQTATLVVRHEMSLIEPADDRRRSPSLTFRSAVIDETVREAQAIRAGEHEGALRPGRTRVVDIRADLDAASLERAREELREDAAYHRDARAARLLHAVGGGGDAPEVEAGRHLVARAEFAAAHAQLTSLRTECERHPDDERRYAVERGEESLLRAHDYHEARRQIYGDRLRADGRTEAEVVPRLNASEVRLLHGFVNSDRDLSADSGARREIKAALDLVTAPAQAQLQTTGRENVLAALRRNAARTQLAEHETLAPFTLYIIEHAGRQHHVSPIDLTLDLTARPERTETLELARLVGGVIDEERARLRAHVAEAERESRRATEERIRVEDQWIQRFGIDPPHGFSPSSGDLREAERLAIASRDAENVAEVSRVEAAIDPTRAAERSRARHVAAIIERQHDAAREERVESTLSTGATIWTRQPKARGLLETILGYLAARREGSERFEQVMGAQSEQRERELRGRAGAVRVRFMVEEYERVVPRLAALDERTRASHLAAMTEWVVERADGRSIVPDLREITEHARRLEITSGRDERTTHDHGAGRNGKEQLQHDITPPAHVPPRAEPTRETESKQHEERSRPTISEQTRDDAGSRRSEPSHRKDREEHVRTR